MKVILQDIARSCEMEVILLESWKRKLDNQSKKSVLNPNIYKICFDLMQTD